MSKQQYVSGELTHFVGRGLAAEEQYSILVNVLTSQFLSHAPHDKRVGGNLRIDAAAKLSENGMYVPQVVCFCDIPLADLSIHMNKYSAFGLSFSKDFIVKSGGSPVFYIARKAMVDTAWSHPPELANSWRKAHSVDDVRGVLSQRTKGLYFDWILGEYTKLREAAGETPGIDPELFRFLDFHVFSYMKFFDHDLADDHPDNYYFEREWRIIGNLEFSIADVVRVILPKRFACRLRADYPGYYGPVHSP